MNQVKWDRWAEDHVRGVGFGLWKITPLGGSSEARVYTSSPPLHCQQCKQRGKKLNTFPYSVTHTSYYPSGFAASHLRRETVWSIQRKKKKKKERKTWDQSNQFGCGSSIIHSFLFCSFSFTFSSAWNNLTRCLSAWIYWRAVWSTQVTGQNMYNGLPPLSHSDHTKGWYVRQPPKMSEHVKVRKNGQQKTATCFATLLKMSWIAMLRVLPPTSNLSYNKSGC